MRRIFLRLIRRAARAPRRQCLPAFSAADGVLRPWDVSFEIVVFDKRLAYSLSENIGALSEEKEDRLVYRSVRLKKRWIKQATDMGFDEVEAWCYLLPGLKELVKQAESALYKRAQDASVSFAPEEQQIAVCLQKRR